jgi:hypothetical protein
MGAHFVVWVFLSNVFIYRLKKQVVFIARRVCIRLQTSLDIGGANDNNIQDGKCKYNIKLRRFLETIVA